MNVLLLFTFGVLFGSAWCEDTCFSKQFASCVSNSIDDINKVYNSCDNLIAQGKCLHSAALDCRIGFVAEASRYELILDYACTKADSYYESFRNCLGYSVNESNCHKQYQEIMMDRKTLQEILRGLKEACKKVDWFGSCLEGNTKDFCGEHQSDYFYKSVFESVIKLNKLLCNEVILPAEDNLHELVILGLPRIIESTVAILTLP
ncbi:uncharacterized protein LOC129989439 [Argiope bruennichi]|uniref:uncharacterized protein LOC129989439 n=1 Tax=Argiope bruennichi TaxID=94029 RepID=UPI00249489D4|nr:uncharacterized protein LOC129989439 [Argiope bruennichi]